MLDCRSLLAGVLLGTLASTAHAQDQPPGPALSTVRDIRVSGTKELTEADVISAARVRVDRPLPDSPDRVAQAVEKHYRDEGYIFATVKAAFDEPSGTLTLTIEEGVIDRVEFVGIGASLAKRFAEEFALRGGDVFNRPRAMEALEALLRPTRGAIRPGGIGARVSDRSGSPFDFVFPDSRDPRRTFDRVDRNGERVLVVGLAEPPGRFKVAPDLGDREDWFTPVDGFVPSLGFGAAVFDHKRFNHAYIAGHLSYKVASHRGGYALGVEKPFFESTKLFLGGELFDLTATDDRWQVSSTEASLAAIGPRRSYRDYYDRRGVQVGGALRPHRQVELLFAWRAERHRPQTARTEFSVWNGDEPFRPNLVAATGRLDALVVGAVVDSQGFEHESLDATYRRHQFESAFGGRLNDLEDGARPKALWRLDWTSEISSPDRFGGDFDFRRHVVNARGSLSISSHQEINVRAIGGWSEGILPPQRLFGIGGIGSVHGYEFKESLGDTLALLNLEYGVGWRHGLRAFGFFDTGRVTSRSSADAPWLNGVGFGIGISGARIDVGYPLEAGRHSAQVLLRFGRTF